MIFYEVSKKIMISAGETSGELYGALLSTEIRKRWPDARIFGIGGPRMKAAGVTIIAPVSHVIGIIEAVKHLWEIKVTFRKAQENLITERPDLLILIDFPDFNLALAKKARAAGIPVLYYVSPQVWAWRSGRVKKIASLADKMAVLFPFEVDCYKNTGLACEFVGHPVAETIKISRPKEEIKESLGLDPQRKVLSLLPGSRPNEIKRHQHIVMEVAAKIKKNFPEIQVVVPLSPGTKFPVVSPDYLKIIYGRTTEALACSEAAAVASGTATLETALLGTPMVVFYSISPVTFYLAKMLINLKFISLVNILSGKEVVKELLQKDANSGMVFSEIRKILEDKAYRDGMITDLKKINRIMQGKRPSARVAEIAGEMAGWNSA